VLVWIVGCGWPPETQRTIEENIIIVLGVRFVGKEKGKQKAGVEKRKDEGEDEARQRPRGQGDVDQWKIIDDRAEGVSGELIQEDVSEENGGCSILLKVRFPRPFL